MGIGINSIDRIIDGADRLRRTIAAIIDALIKLDANKAYGVFESEIDFGATPAREKTFTVTDANVKATHQIVATHSAAAATGRVQDENELDSLLCKCVAGNGQFTMYVVSLCGPVIGKYKVNYLIG
jgi:hypothetical protein